MPYRRFLIKRNLGCCMGKRRCRSRKFKSNIHKGENNEMMYLSMAIHNIAVMIFTAYMVIHVHPIWAVCILFTHRIGTKIVRVPIEEDTKDDAVDDSNESGRDEF